MAVVVEKVESGHKGLGMETGYAYRETCMRCAQVMDIMNGCTRAKSYNNLIRNDSPHKGKEVVRK
jgi:hypothetical protein